MKVIYVLLIIFFYNFYEISVFKIEKVSLKSSKINRNYRFIQISDFHNNLFINKNKLFKKIRKFSPDAIFLTGDIISRNTSDFSNVETLLKGLMSFKMYFVQGNHELDNKNSSDFYNLLKKYGVEDISSEERILEDNINLYGNPFGTMFRKDFYLNKSFYNILLTHDPKEFINTKDKYDLVLAGHNHGGQVRLPFVGQIFNHSGEIFPKYSKGLYKVEGTDFYMDSGLGQSLPFRMLNRVQITEFIIEKEYLNY